VRRRGGYIEDMAWTKPDQIAFALEQDICSGKLQYGTKLESENQLVQRFSVSRSTVRKGLETLSEKGLITTRMGIGSFVTFGGEIIDNSQGWTRALANREASVETKLLRCEIVTDAELAEHLGQELATFIAIDRIRSLARDGRVVSVERSRVPYLSELDEVPLRGLTEGSLSKTLAEAGLIGESGEEWAEVVRIDETDAVLFDAEVGTAYLQTRRLVHDIDDRVIEYVVSLLDPDHFALHLEY